MLLPASLLNQRITSSPQTSSSASSATSTTRPGPRAASQDRYLAMRCSISGGSAPAGLLARASPCARPLITLRASATPNAMAAVARVLKISVRKPPGTPNAHTRHTNARYTSARTCQIRPITAHGSQRRSGLRPSPARLWIAAATGLPDPHDDQRDHAGDHEEQHVQPQSADRPRQPEVDGRGEHGAAVDRRPDDPAAPARALPGVRVRHRQQAQLRRAWREDAPHQREGGLGRDGGVDQRCHDQPPDAPGLHELERDIGGHGKGQHGQQIEQQPQKHPGGPGDPARVRTHRQPAAKRGERAMDQQGDENPGAEHDEATDADLDPTGAPVGISPLPRQPAHEQRQSLQRCNDLVRQAADQLRRPRNGFCRVRQRVRWGGLRRGGRRALSGEQGAQVGQQFRALDRILERPDQAAQLGLVHGCGGRGCGRLYAAPGRARQPLRVGHGTADEQQRPGQPDRPEHGSFGSGDSSEENQRAGSDAGQVATRRVSRVIASFSPIRTDNRCYFAPAIL